VAQQIRLFKPDVVITHNPEDIIAERKDGMSRVNHRDHRNTGRSVIDACYPYSRDISFFPEHFSDKEAASHKVVELLIADSHNHPAERFIDVTEFMDDRKKAIASHKSQFDDGAVERVTYTAVLNEDGKYFERFRYAKIR
jgi:LmbE family N-acetylglucosaminyl deacetylase